MTGNLQTRVTRNQGNVGRRANLRLVVVCLLCVLFIWILACALFQLGWMGIWKIRAALIVFAAAVLVILFRPLIRRLSVGMFLSLFLAAAYLRTTGSGSWTLLLIASSFLLAQFLVRWIKAPTWLVFLAFAWMFCSLSIYVQHRERLTPERFRELRKDSLYKNVRMALALSGGGYRAALFHAGVLSALEEAKFPPTELSTVSGGSIIGAFYVAGGLPQDFVRAVSEGEFNLKRDLLAFQNVIRLPFPAEIPGTQLKLLPWYRFSRTDVQANQLDRILFGGATFSDIAASEAPVLMICATDLARGRTVALTSKGTLMLLTLRPLQELNPRFTIPGEWFPYLPDVVPSDYEERHFPSSRRIAELVATSGAFPLALPAESYSIKYLIPHEEPVALELHLSDGGVTDNSGVSLILAAEDISVYMSEVEAKDPGNDPAIVRTVLNMLQDWRTDIVIASDASSILRDLHGSEGSLDSIRAMDLIYSRVGARKPSYGWRLKEHKPCPPAVVVVSAQTMFPYPAVGGPLDTKEFFESYLSPLIYEMDDSVFELMLSDFPENTRHDLMAERRNRRHTICWNSADDKLAKLITPELERGLQTFANADTLREQFSQAEASELFRLGRYLLLLEMPYIQQQLRRRESAKADCLGDSGDAEGLSISSDVGGVLLPDAPITLKNSAKVCK